jgi:hypothetical protein
MMTPYDAWKTNVEDTNEEAWEDAVDQVAHGLSDSYQEEIVSTIANSDDVLTWLSYAVEVPQHHLHAFRDLIKLASGLRKEVETEMKANRMIPDAD